MILVMEKISKLEELVHLHIEASDNGLERIGNFKLPKGVRSLKFGLR